MASVAGPSAISTGRSTPVLKKMPAQSSFIAQFEYDEANLTLTTHLKSGAVYQHKFVVPSEFVALQTARNQSKHWADNIRGKKQSVCVVVKKAPRSELKTGRK
jgi:predicted  nucleic acid-binding Zn ribbon protein